MNHFDIRTLIDEIIDRRHRGGVVAFVGEGEAMLVDPLV